MTNYILFGKSGAGKDTVCNIIKEYYTNKNIIEPEVIRLSEPVRYVASKLIHIFPTLADRMSDENLLKSHQEYSSLKNFLWELSVEDDIFEKLKNICQSYQNDVYRGIENRNMLQDIGLAMRKFSFLGEYVLSNYVQYQIKICTKTHVFIIPDGRTIEEFHTFKDKFVSIYIDSNRSERLERVHKRDYNQDISYLDNQLEKRTEDTYGLCNYVIFNKDLDQLKREVIRILEEEDAKSKKS